VPPEAGRAARDDEASAPCVGRPDITQPSSLITSTPTGGSRAGAGRFSHWPHPGGGTSSSGTSTTATWLPPAWPNANKTDGVVVPVVITTVMAVATRCGSVAAAALREGLLVVTAVLPVSLGALDERCLMGTDTSDLSALAGARGGTIGPTLRTHKKRLGSSLSKPEHLEERLLTSRRRSRASSSSRVQRTPLWRLSPPPRHPQTPPKHAPALPRRAPLLPRTARWRVLPRPPRAPAPLPPLQLLATGVEVSTSRGEPTPRCFLLLPLPTTRTPRSPGEKVLAARAAGTPRPAVPGAPAAGSSAPSCALPALAPFTEPRACARAQGVGGSDCVASTATLC
jgi:hypothetical protein